jgi:dihydrofolate reductase
MPINIIACVANYKNKLAIGKNNGLLFKLRKDLSFFKTVTMTNYSNQTEGSLPSENVVLMGRKTWFSISREKRPLKNRLNLILTNDPDLLRISPLPKSHFNNLYDFTILKIQMYM